MLASFSQLSSYSSHLSSHLGDRTHPVLLRHHSLLLGQWLLDQPGLERHGREITKALALLRFGSVASLSEALGSICHEIKTALPKGVATLIFKASCESSSVLFAQDIVELAQVYRREGDFLIPQGLYSLALQALPETSECKSFRENLQRELLVLQGQGSFRDNLYLSAERVRHEMMGPTVLAMGVGGLSNALGTKFFGNLLKGSVGPASRVLLARTGGMATDAIFFTSMQHGIAVAQGKPTNDFSHNLLHAGLMLTSLRVTGSLARTALGTPVMQATLRNLGSFTKRAVEVGVPLGAEFQGILRANQLGAEFGLGQVSAHAGLDTLFTMTHFRMAQSWLKLSPHYTQLHSQLTRETETTLRDLGNRTYQSWQRLGLRWYESTSSSHFTTRKLAYDGIFDEATSSQVQESLDLIHSYLRIKKGNGSGSSHGGVSERDLREQFESLDRQLQEELTLALEQLIKIAESKEESLIQTYQEELAELETRAQFWQAQATAQREYSGKTGTEYLCDIVIGQEILFDRVLQFSGRIFAETLTRTGRLSSPRPRELHPPRLEAEATSLAGRFPALVNREVGFGRSLTLRPHQEDALNAIRSRWNLILQRIAAQPSAAFKEALFCGNILMPVGGGKTRTMIAALAAGIEIGALQAGRGDKYIILGHTDRIHRQNVASASMLSSYFHTKIGRALRISEYKAENKDLTGDVIVVSIPTVNQEGARATFLNNLKNELGTEGRIAMVGVDEVHHLSLGKSSGRESWPELVAGLRGLSPQLFQLGFTATPTRHERHVLYRISELELMALGVTPRRYLVRVNGEDLSQLKVASSSGDDGDFSQKELVSALLTLPGRNQRIYQALEAQGLRRAELSPSGREQLGATLIFGADLKHAQMMAENYLEYFGTPSEGVLRGRRFLFLGKDRGKIKDKEFQTALRQYEQGETDGVVVLVSGNTDKSLEGKILKAWEEGKVEAVFTVDSLVEGADLYMAANQIGGRPTFSLIRKRQEGGRSNRRAPHEVANDGRFTTDAPKVLFDVIDHYNSFDRQLVYYGTALGVRNYFDSTYGVLFDALAGSSVSTVDLVGRSHQTWDKPKPARPEDLPPPRPRPEDPWSGLIDRLRQILTDQYQGNIEALALDLGEPVEYIEALLTGQAWEGQYWFLRRMATLLYQDRDHLVGLWHEAKGEKGSELSERELAALRSALKQYRSWEGLSEEAAVESKQEELHALGINGSQLRAMNHGTLSETQWRDMASQLMQYFKRKAVEEGFTEAQAATEQLLALRTAIFARYHWRLQANNAREALLIEARQLVALHYGGILPTRTGIAGVSQQNVQATLTRWLGGETIQFGKGNSFHEFYGEVRALLMGLGTEEVKVNDLIEAAVFEEQSWDRKTSIAKEKLLFEARRLVALHYGGVLPMHTGIAGIPRQYARLPLSRWLGGEAIQYGTRCPPQNFYNQVRALLMGLGAEETKVNDLIEAAVFEEQGWDRVASTAKEKLLFETRQLVALHYGGVLSMDTGIAGVSVQTTRATLTRWLGGEAIQYNNNCRPQNFYNQVRALLMGLGAEEAKVNDLIGAAVFEEQGWDRVASTVKEKLLFETRQLVALHYGGILPTRTGIAGVSQQNIQATLTRWLRGEAITHPRNFSSNEFYSQVEALLMGLGAEETEVNVWIEAARKEDKAI